MRNNINIFANLKKRRNILLKIKTTVFLILFIPLSVNAEYNALKLGEAAGSYLYSIYLIHAFKNSQCSYVSIKEIPIEPIINDIKQTLTAGDWAEMESILNKGTIKTKAKQGINNSYNNYNNSYGLDFKTSCGALFQNIVIQYDTAKKKWNNAKKKYSQ